MRLNKKYLILSVLIIISIYLILIIAQYPHPKTEIIVNDYNDDTEKPIGDIITDIYTLNSILDNTGELNQPLSSFSAHSYTSSLTHGHYGNEILVYINESTDYVRLDYAMYFLRTLLQAKHDYINSINNVQPKSMKLDSTKIIADFEIVGQYHKGDEIEYSASYNLQQEIDELYDNLTTDLGEYVEPSEWVYVAPLPSQCESNPNYCDENPACYLSGMGEHSCTEICARNGKIPGTEPGTNYVCRSGEDDPNCPIWESRNGGNQIEYKNNVYWCWQSGQTRDYDVSDKLWACYCVQA